MKFIEVCGWVGGGWLDVWGRVWGGLVAGSEVWGGHAREVNV